MSSESPIPPANPYQAPYSAFTPTLPQSQPSMPTFCLVMFILSLIFCFFRIPLVIIGAITWLSLQPNAENAALFTTAPYEVLSGAAIVLLGVPANIGVLMKRRWGATLGFLTIGASLFSLAVAVWQLSVLYQATDDPAERSGFIAGAAITLLLRTTIIGLYAMAVLKLSQWLNVRDRAA